MRLALSMIVRNEAFYLSLILPIIRECFDEFVAVDAFSTDATKDILKRFGCRIVEKTWTTYSDARNIAIQSIESDWTIMLDADEALFPEDIELLRRIMETENMIALVLPKHEFLGDHDHHDPHWYPDLKKRIFKMNSGYRYEGKLHERLISIHETKENIRTVPEIHMYHYGQSKPPEVTWLRHSNYDRLAKGIPLLAEIPADLKVARRLGVPFLRPHPLKGVPPAMTVEEYRKPRL